MQEQPKKRNPRPTERCAKTWGPPKKNFCSIQNNRWRRTQVGTTKFRSVGEAGERSFARGSLAFMTDDNYEIDLPWSVDGRSGIRWHCKGRMCQRSRSCCLPQSVKQPNAPARILQSRREISNFQEKLHRDGIFGVPRDVPARAIATLRENGTRTWDVFLRLLNVDLVFHAISFIGDGQEADAMNTGSCGAKSRLPGAQRKP
jgi:hypothetical protein